METVMRKFWLWILLVCLASLIGISVQADDFKLTNGEVIKGRAAGSNEEGLIVALEIGGFSERIPWTKLSQESLKLLSKDPRMKVFVTPFIEIPVEVKIKRAARERERSKYTLRFEPKLTRPEPGQSFFSGMVSPVGLGILGLLYLANLFAAWEIAAFRERSPALVCGASAILPVIAPVVFLSLPVRRPDMKTSASEAMEEDTSTGGTGAPAAGGTTLTASRPKFSGGSTLQPATYPRGEFTFNRRFFESKFPGFFRVVLGEAEKDFVLVFRTNRDDHIVRRIARITSNDIHILLIKGAEIGMSFDEIREVQLRKKEPDE
jgi:hypothetical protein